MTWEMVAVLLLVPLFVFVRVVRRAGRRRRGRFAGSRSTTILTLPVQVPRTFGKRKRAALEAATGVLR